MALAKKWKNRQRWTCERCGREYVLPDGPARTVKRETGASAWTMIGGLKTCEACAAARFKRRRTLGGGVLGEHYFSLGLVRKFD